MSAPPDCGKCSKAHWRFTRCEEVTAPKATRAPVTVRQPLPEGVRVWGDRFASVERRGDSTFLKPRTRPLETGRVTYPEGTHGPEETT